MCNTKKEIIKHKKILREHVLRMQKGAFYLQFKTTKYILPVSPEFASSLNVFLQDGNENNLTLKDYTMLQQINQLFSTQYNDLDELAKAIEIYLEFAADAYHQNIVIDLLVNLSIQSAILTSIVLMGLGFLSLGCSVPVGLLVGLAVALVLSVAVGLYLHFNPVFNLRPKEIEAISNNLEDFFQDSTFEPTSDSLELLQSR